MKNFVKEKIIRNFKGKKFPLSLIVGVIFFLIFSFFRIQKQMEPPYQSELLAATYVSVSVRVTLRTITALADSGNPGTLIINSATPGSDPTTAQDSSTQYKVSTNATNRIVVARLNSAMPSGLTLSIELDSTGIGTSQGEKVLTTTNSTLITGITQTFGIKNIIYRFKAGLTPNPQSGSRTVTLQII